MNGGEESSTSPFIHSIVGRRVKNDEMQGARILRNEVYNQYAARTKDEAQRRRSRFSTACQDNGQHQDH